MCVTCRRTTDGFERCWQCNQHFQSFGAELADEVAPISLAFKGKQLAHVLFHYKDAASETVRRRFTDELLTVLASFPRPHVSVDRCARSATRADQQEVRRDAEHLR
ncbi:hypothetical protein ACIA8G_22865 [Lentzea sp. NPDC051213]|uniref:hypothetical protein n=1 Tax=Lentzea sp. NPDC051213 TaxID=3364126 RepID=UPI0037AFC2F6